MNITINSSVEHLYNQGLLTKQCKEVLDCLEVNDVFDIMTTKFPEENQIVSKHHFLFREPPIIYTRKIKEKIDNLINYLYTSQENYINP